jgi:sarcosine oxidase gamma subunit
MSDDYRARLAEAAGYTGEKAQTFAALLQGDTEQELSDHAARLVDLAGSLAPPPMPAYDPSQGRGMALEPSPDKWFLKKIDEIATRPRDQRGNPWREMTEPYR